MRWSFLYRIPYWFATSHQEVETKIIFPLFRLFRGNGSWCRIKLPIPKGEQRTLYLFEHARWIEADGEHLAHKWNQVSVPPAIAESALRHNLADYFDSARATKIARDVR